MHADGVLMEDSKTVVRAFKCTHTHTHTHTHSVCKSMKSWLDSDPLHVAVVHCKGGKGRTGCVIAAFMHYSAICER